MESGVRWVVAAALLAGSSAVGAAQGTGGGVGGPGAGTARPTVTFEMVRPGLPVPRFRIAVREDGTGTYAGVEGSGPAQGGSDGGAPGAAVERTVALNPKTTLKIFKMARAQRYFAVTCASKAKNIADTGAKVLSYEGADGRGSCSYNFSENKDVMALTDLFLGIAETIEEGRKLAFDHRYDHLGLDAELEILAQANESGRAVELSTIEPQLRALAVDTELMERVRMRATKLLDRAAEGR